MGLNVEDVIAGLDPAKHRKVEELAAEFISEEMTLCDRRKARHLTQVSVARELGVSQDAVSRIEQRSDLLLSTLRRTIEAMGGTGYTGSPCSSCRRCRIHGASVLIPKFAEL
ncbi:MAG: helix-turn-helix transcriptional regulator [Deltaproteobacteria bacterium]|nr:helix-turn-helix transcriptional regulator [Deltaproteobacteria bacterium]